ncbi:aminotransferase class V-fold PLP-dependent enzyme [Staphylococcus devriesei]|uniref:aminotransferase class V-fold PLP-dependent enzyme n=1 Tax=Staphylococcus devriesei TaxID=586733 RepID=UPI000E6A005E|nr:aminotransferase class V-fold PLP-dependent enzyme [Staphylococcus devriesei]RIL73138.1 aminotransferase class V-fold PLP-dependent enzyme [Staphylococcus devriesei]
MKYSHLPITTQLNKLIDNQAISLHVPGHKNMTIGHLRQLKKAMDMTEITGLDDLHHPEAIILDSMKMINKHPDYDAYFLVNGTTSGILAVIQTFSNRDGNYLLSRNVHKSVFHGIDLTRQSADLMPMIKSTISQHYLQPDFERMNYNQQNLAILTYPNYYGECFDINTSVQSLQQHHIPVLVDEAHGAHFGLSHFPKSALETGADFVVQSYHKTLPTLTMGSVLFIHKDAPLKEEVVRYLEYFQTSSPSYLIMASIELAHQFYKDYDSNSFFEKREEFINVLIQRGFEVVRVDDPLKLLIRYSGYSGYEVQDWFETSEIYTELADEYQTLIILPLWHEGDSYPFQKLLKKIETMKLPLKKDKELKSLPLVLEEGFYSSESLEHTKWIDIEFAENKILAKHLTPYPPGIPIFLKGEKISQNMIKLMQYYLQGEGRVEGMKNNKILVKDE